MMVANRKHANTIMEKVPCTLTYDNGVGKLFKTSRPFSVYSMVDRSRQRFFPFVRGKK